MRIYDYKGYPNPARVRLALAEKGLTDQVAFIHVDVPSGAHRKPEFLAKNPSGVVPVLELDDETYISECTAITEYLDHATGEPLLTGRSAKERAIIHMMQRKIEAGFLDSVHAYFHHATEGLGLGLPYKSESWGRHRKDVAVAALHWMDDVLATRTYFAGDRFTVADITAMGGVAFGALVDITIPKDCRNLSAWRDRVWARPSAATAF